MTRYEAITKYRNTIEAEMVRLYRSVVDSNGRVMYKLYVWEDGEIEVMEAPQGDNGWLKANDYEPRKLFPVTDIEESADFSIWDASEYGEPEDPAEAEALREEIIEYEVTRYENVVPDIIDNILDEAKWEETL